MSEIKIKLDEIHPVELLGTNNANLEILKKKFPKLKIFVRGKEIKAQGDISEIERFDEKLQQLIKYTLQQGHISENAIQEILSSDTSFVPDSDILVYGNNGIIVRAKTPNQQKLYQETLANDVVFAIGPAGTGKTYTSVAIAVRALRNREVRRIILTRPAVEAGESFGYLPGDIREKIDPYLQPLYDALHDMIPADKLKYYLDNKTIEIAPLAFMRGRTLNNAFVILDEAQNSTSMQLKMFLTRLGPDAKFIINGDLTQVDLPMKQSSGLMRAIRLIQGIKGIGVVELDVTDVTRHRLVKEIIQAYDKESERRNASS